MVIYPVSLFMISSALQQLLAPMFTDLLILTVCFIKKDSFVFVWWVKIVIDSVSFFIFQVYLLVGIYDSSKMYVLFGYFIIAVVLVPIAFNLIMILYQVQKIAVQILRAIKKMMIKKKTKSPLRQLRQWTSKRA